MGAAETQTIRRVTICIHIGRKIRGVYDNIPNLVPTRRFGSETLTVEDLAIKYAPMVAVSGHSRLIDEDILFADEISSTKSVCNVFGPNPFNS